MKNLLSSVKEYHEILLTPSVRT